MNTLEHMQRVQPSTGFLVLAIFDPKSPKPRHEFYSTVEQLATAALREDVDGNNTYYAISSFQKKTRRNKENVLATKVLVLDVDCGAGKPYPSWKEGLAALGKFVEVVGLPKPMVVHSGNGLHVYWILTEELPPEQWQPLADALKLATQQHDFKVDPAPTANSALVLRPIGTHNPKNGKEVRLLIDAGPYDYADLAAVLHPAIAGTPSHNNGKHFGGSKLLQNLAVHADSTTIAATVATKCQQIKWGIANPDKVEEPIWYAMMGVAGYCTEPDATAIEWSVGHPKFNAPAAVAKMKQWVKSSTGPATCERFDDVRPGGCKGCPFKGKIVSPAQLGVHHQEITVLPEGLPVSVLADIELPKPYKRTTSGIVEIRDGVELAVCPFNLYPVSYGIDPALGYEVARFMWERKPGSWNELALRQSLLNNSEIRDFAKATGDHGVILRHSAHQLPRLQDMLRSYIVDLHRKRDLTNYCSTMGWKLDDASQFVIGNTVFRRNPDSTVEEETTTLSTQVGELGYTAKGTLQKAVKATGLLGKLDLQVQMFSLCVSLSSPLYKFTKLHAQTISLYGDTGSGKTLAQMWAQSVWGDPDLLHLGAKYTSNALYQRMGVACHLPITVDEFTTKDVSETGEFLYEVTQGRDKMRLTQRAEAKPTAQFAMPIIISTIMSLSGKLQGASTHSDAQLIRLLEVKVIPNQYLVDNPLAADHLRTLITENYGHIGREFLRRLVALGPDTINKAIDAAKKEFTVVYGVVFSGVERYWLNMLMLAHLAGKWAAEWGLISFDYQRGIRWALDQLPGIRRTVASSKKTALDLVTEYLGKYSSTTVHEDHSGPRTVVNPGNNMHGSIFVRIIRWRDKPMGPFHTGTVYVESNSFKNHIRSQQCDVTATLDELEKLGLLKNRKEARRSLAKGTPFDSGTPRVIIIDLNHDQLRSILDPTVSDDDHADRHLHVV